MSESFLRRVNWSLILGGIVHAVTAIVFLVKLDNKADQGLVQLQAIAAKVETIQNKIHELDVRVTRIESVRGIGMEWRDRANGNP